MNLDQITFPKTLGKTDLITQDNQQMKLAFTNVIYVEKDKR